MRMGHPAYTPTKPPSCRPGALTRRPDLVHNENCCVRCKLRIGITCAVLNVPVRSCGVCTVDSESAGKGVAQEGGGQVVERGELVSEPRFRLGDRGQLSVRCLLVFPLGEKERCRSEALKHQPFPNCTARHGFDELGPVARPEPVIEPPGA